MYITICKIDDQCIQCMKQGTQSQYSGTTQRDELERDVEGGVQDGGSLNLYVLYYKTSPYFLQIGAENAEGINPLWLSAWPSYKAVLFSLTQNSVTEI